MRLSMKTQWEQIEFFMFHQYPEASGFVHNVRSSLSLLVANSHDQSSPVPVFACCKYIWTLKKHHAFLSLAKKCLQRLLTKPWMNITIHTRSSPSCFPLRWIFLNISLPRKLLYSSIWSANNRSSSTFIIEAWSVWGKNLAMETYLYALLVTVCYSHHSLYKSPECFPLFSMISMNQARLSIQADTRAYWIALNYFIEIFQGDLWGEWENCSL